MYSPLQTTKSSIDLPLEINIPCSRPARSPNAIGYHMQQTIKPKHFFIFITIDRQLEKAESFNQSHHEQGGQLLRLSQPEIPFETRSLADPPEQRVPVRALAPPALPFLPPPPSRQLLL